MSPVHTRGICMGAKLTACAVAIAVWTALASGQEPSPRTKDPRDQSDKAVLEALEGPAEATAVSLKELHQKVLDLQSTLRHVQEMLAAKMLAITEIEDENRKLREALRLRYGRERSGLPPVPMPHKKLIESVLGQSGRTDQPFEEPSRDTGANTYTIVGQWGRSPEVAAGLPGNVSSLIGVAAVVAPGMPPNEVEALGKELHQTYNAYDNINIQVFDNVAAAKDYADTGTSSAAHLILSISKHRHSQHDKIFRFQNGLAIEVQ